MAQDSLLDGALLARDSLCRLKFVGVTERGAESAALLAYRVGPILAGLISATQWADC
jgi:hypothetical protein